MKFSILMGTFVSQSTLVCCINE